MDKLLTKQQVAEALQSTVRFVEKLMAAGELPYRKIGKLVRFHESDVEKVGVLFGATPSPNHHESTRTAEKAGVQNQPLTGKFG